jgi:hypothetical protein
MKKFYGFVPNVPLADGIGRLRDFLLTRHHAA